MDSPITLKADYGCWRVLLALNDAQSDVIWVFCIAFFAQTHSIRLGSLALFEDRSVFEPMLLEYKTTEANWLLSVVREAYFHFIHAFGNGRWSCAREPIAKSVEWKCSKKRRRPMQREFQVTYFANNNNNNNNKLRYLYCSCIFNAWQLLNDNSFYSVITHELNIMQSPSVKDWLYNNNVAEY